MQAARERLQGETGLSATGLDNSNIKRGKEQFITERAIGRIKGIDKPLFLNRFPCKIVQSTGESTSEIHGLRR